MSFERPTRAADNDSEAAPQKGEASKAPRALGRAATGHPCRSDACTARTRDSSPPEARSSKASRCEGSFAATPFTELDEDWRQHINNPGCLGRQRFRVSSACSTQRSVLADGVRCSAGSPLCQSMRAHPHEASDRSKVHGCPGQPQSLSLFRFPAINCSTLTCRVFGSGALSRTD